MVENKQAALKRLARIEGQVRGVARMIEEDRYCVDVLAQTAAIASALRGVEKLILEDHAAHCVEHAIASGDPEEQRARFAELVEIVNRTR